MRQIAIALLLAAVASIGNAADAARPDAKIEQGREVYQYWCATCHGKGPGMPGTLALQTKYGGKKPALLEERRDLTPELTRFFVRNGVSVMPPFRKTEIRDAELDALAAYLARRRR
jgi:(+)-pinoresinol hydroxylase